MKKFILFIFIGLSSSIIKSQIICGQNGIGIQFYDFVPDTNLTAISGGSAGNHFACFLDLNRDAINDFKIDLVRIYNPGGGSRVSKIECLNNNSVVIDSAGGYVSVLMNGMNINSSNFWSLPGATVNMESYCYYSMSGTTYYSGDWSYINDAYAGVRIITVSDTVIGYIHMATYHPMGSIKIMDYGITYSILTDTLILTDTIVNSDTSEISDTVSGIFNSISKKFKISPCPFNENLTIRSTDFNETNLILRSLGGETLLEKNFSGTISIDTRDLKQGLYFYELRSGREKQYGKLIKSEP
ncbi:MAG TPA: T9SS type A sorting domain-containing protein [Bacteroidia bacterium]|jgi:hypothetical protein